MLVRMDDAAAVAYADHGAGRPSQLTMLAREIKEREVVAERTVVALYIAGVYAAVGGAPSRSSTKASGGDEFPERELRLKFRSMVPQYWGDGRRRDVGQKGAQRLVWPLPVARAFRL